MNFKRLFNDINIESTDKFYLVLLLCFSILLTVVLVKFNNTRGAFNPDIYAYLAGALEVSGLNVNGIQGAMWIQNSPVIIFLTSLLFRLGFVDINAIFIVTGVFGILGIMGMYVFLKIRFSPLLSFAGSILFCSLSLTLYYFANGMLDIPAVSLIIWTLIFTVAASNKNYKYYVLVAFLFCMTFFVRFTTAYIISLILLYFLKDHDIINLIECLFKDRNNFKQRIFGFIKSNEFKWISISVIFGICIFLIVLKILFNYHSDLSYFYMAQSSMNGFSNPNDVNHVYDNWFYIKNFMNFLSSYFIVFNEQSTELFLNVTPLSYMLIILLLIGFLLKSVNVFKNLNSKQITFRTKNSTYILILCIIILLFVSIVGFNINYMISLVCLFSIYIILLSLIKTFPINKDLFALSLMCFALFSFYLVIVSYVDLKCARYLLPAFPAFIYFEIYCIDYILNYINTGFDNENSLLKKFRKPNLDYNFDSKSVFKRKITKFIPILFILICLMFTFNFTNTVEINQDHLDRIEFTDFIKQYDSDYQSKTFMGFRELRIFEWYLNKDILKWGSDVKEKNSINQDYIITEVITIDYPNYKEVYHLGKYHLYEHK